ncbi:AtpZ/AtpI family protein [Winogradskyella sp. MH6]|uniref:AtpZ/AtpI family protein n=1 Tax=Winogradskyella sp. MH6 TaxID=2929510 RepID=UPI001FB1FF20|nr:AtpZ/AtpI family protein [Winogradskyella sp. MH6]
MKQQNQNNQNKPPKDNKGKYNKFLRFTSVALQMGLTIYAGNLLGMWLDSKYNSDKFEPSITLLAVFASMYMVIAQVIKVSKE